MVYLGQEGQAPARFTVDTASPLVLMPRSEDGGRQSTTLKLFEPVECQDDGACTEAARPTCDRSSGRCMPSVASCTADAQCAAPAPHCVNGACQASAAECILDSQCTGGQKTHCSAGRCVLFNPRFVFKNLEVYDLAVKPVGLDSPVALGGVLGVPLLEHYVLRLSYSPLATMTLLDEIPDSNEELADDCDHDRLLSGKAADVAGCTGVFASPRVGGGLLPEQDTGCECDSGLAPTRQVLDLCLMPAVFDATLANPKLKPEAQTHGAVASSGVPVQAVLATGLGMSVIARSAYERLKPLLGSTAAGVQRTLYLPYGKETVTVISLARAAVVSNETQSLGPCAEMALRLRLLLANVVGLSAADVAMLEDKRMNGASLALLTTPVQVAVVPDESPLIQGLRQELQPATADVDMLIGGSLLRHFELEVDFPNSRTILRCTQASTLKGCQVMPFCAHKSNSDRKEILCPEAP